MTDHPSTYKAAQTGSSGIDWDDGASIHRRDDGQGVLDAMKALHRGTLAEMVRMIADMPAEERGDFVIEKAGGLVQVRSWRWRTGRIFPGGKRP